MIRVALLGLGGNGAQAARNLARVLLSDALSDEQAWEAEILQSGRDGRSLLIRYGDREDVVFCQYREQGVFKERGYTTKEFMSQLLANKNDSGKGRNMPIHYGSRDLHIVSCPARSS